MSDINKYITVNTFNNVNKCCLKCRHLIKYQSSSLFGYTFRFSQYSEDNHITYEINAIIV